MRLFLGPMFALYHLPNRKKTSQFIGLSAHYFEIKFRGENLKIPLNEIAKTIIEMRRRLAPLIIGGIITSLSLLSMLLFSYGLEVVGLTVIGLFLTYYGMQEYVVIHVEHSNTTELIWLPHKVSLASIRPFIGLLEFYVSRRHFPVLYASHSEHKGSRIVHYENKPVIADTEIYYSFRPNYGSRLEPIAVNPAKLDAPITIYGTENIIGKSNNLINHEALIEDNTVSYS
jgi:hypothetical protein